MLREALHHRTTFKNSSCAIFPWPVHSGSRTWPQADDWQRDQGVARREPEALDPPLQPFLFPLWSRSSAQSPPGAVPGGALGPVGGAERLIYSE